MSASSIRRFEWNGDYSDASSKWTVALRKEVQRLVAAETKKLISSHSSTYKLKDGGKGGATKQADDGAFWMSLQDFCRFFSDVGLCDPWIFGSTCYTVVRHGASAACLDFSSSLPMLLPACVRACVRACVLRRPCVRMGLGGAMDWWCECRRSSWVRQLLQQPFVPPHGCERPCFQASSMCQGQSSRHAHYFAV
jgi:hypothetical protein